jgi:peptidoglycan/LPS O-acetylase OafA/YrhL
MGQTWGPTGMAARAHYPALTGLRFCAALFVLLFHTVRGPYDVPLITFPPGIREVLSEGRAAVGLFFVLSGFVLTVTYLDWFAADLRRFVPYARARFARVYPLHLLMLLIISPLSLVAIGAVGSAQRPTTDTLVWTWLANLLLVHAFIPMPIVHIWHAPSWSLVNEFFFYALFPLFIRHVLAHLSTARQVLLLASGLYVAQIALFLAFVWWLSSRPGAADDPGALEWSIQVFVDFFPPLRVWEFWIGCCLGLLLLRARDDPARWLGWLWRPSPLWTGVVVGAVGAWLGLVWLGQAFRDTLPLIAWANWYVTGTPVAVLLIGGLAVGIKPLAPLLAHPLLITLGEASYALYMIHWLPLLTLVLAIEVFGSLPAWVAPLTVVATILASIVCHDRIEQPLRRALRAWPAPAHDPKRATRPEA